MADLPPRYINVSPDVVYDEGLPDPLFRTYLRLRGLAWATNYRETPALWPEEVMGVCGCSERSLRGHLAALRERGLITVQRRSDGRMVIRFPEKGAGAAPGEVGVEGRQSFAGAEDLERQTFAEAEEQERQTFAGAKDPERQTFAGAEEQERQTFAGAKDPERQTFAGAEERERQSFAGTEMKRQTFAAGEGSERQSFADSAAKRQTFAADAVAAAVNDSEQDQDFRKRNSSNSSSNSSNNAGGRQSFAAGGGRKRQSFAGSGAGGRRKRERGGVCGEADVVLPEDLLEKLGRIGFCGPGPMRELREAWRRNPERVRGWVEYVLSEIERGRDLGGGYLLKALRSGEDPPRGRRPEDDRRRYIEGDHVLY
jgi:DNA-binding transcriptional ArsR family regulator